jgi:hypothetical protein
VKTAAAALGLALLAAVPARAGTAARAVSRTLDRVAALLARENGADARTIAALDRRADGLYTEIAPRGWRAAAPLGEAALDAGRPEKVRLFAVVFLSRLGDPAAFAPLSRVALDPYQPLDLRSAAVQGLAALEVPREAARRVLCRLTADADAPRSLLDEALIPAERLGCADPAPLERLARRFGPRPKGADRETVLRAVRVLARSRGEAAVRALLGLVSYFPPLGPARAAAISALGRRAADLAADPGLDPLPVLGEALRTQTADPATMVVLVRLTAGEGPASEGLLLPLIDHPDAEVLAETAEALARLRCVKALPGLEAAAAGAMSDPRFGPEPGRPDPAVLLVRVQDAATALRRDADARR